MDEVYYYYYYFTRSQKSSEVTTKEAPGFSKAESANIGCCETAVFTAFEISLGYLISKAYVSISLFDSGSSVEVRLKKVYLQCENRSPERHTTGDDHSDFHVGGICGHVVLDFQLGCVQWTPHLPWNWRFPGKRVAHFPFANQGKMQTR